MEKFLSYPSNTLKYKVRLSLNSEHLNILLRETWGERESAKQNERVQKVQICR